MLFSRADEGISSRSSRAILAASSNSPIGENLLLSPLNRNQIRTWKVSDRSIAGSASPPVRRIAHGITAAKDSDKIALFHGEIDA